MSTHQDSDGIVQFFDSAWTSYQDFVVKCDLMFHKKMFATLNHVLRDRFANKALTLADFGCGDASAIYETLKNNHIEHYIGVDSSAALISSARDILRDLSCKKTLICQNMADAISSLNKTMDVIFCAFSLHHLSLNEKVKFISSCNRLLNPNGCLLIVDVSLAETDTLDQWITRLEQHFLHRMPDRVHHEVLSHVRAADLPEKNSTFRNIATKQHWANFEILGKEANLFSFLAFTK